MEINRKEMLAALNSVQPGLHTKNVVEQASCFAFRDNKVFTFNDEIAVSCPLTHDIEGAVPADKLFKLLNKVPDETISVETIDKELEIKGKRIKATIKLEEKISMPLDELTEPDEWFDLPVGFSDGMKYALMSTGTDMSKPILTCVHWTSKHIESCDNFRITRYVVDSPETKNNILIPASSVTKLVKYAPSEYCIVAGWAHFKTQEGCVFSCRVFEGKYSNLDDFINATLSDTVVAFPTVTNEILDRVSVLSQEDVTGAPFATVEIKDKTLTISGKSDFGSIEETARINCKVDVLFSVKVETLEHILRRFREGTISENGAAIKFTSKNLTHVVSLMTAE